MEKKFKQSRALIVLLANFSTLALTAPAHAQQSCVDMFAGAIQQIEKSERLSYMYSSFEKNICKSNERNFNAGFSTSGEAIIKGVPTSSKILGNLGINSNKQLCEAIDNDNINFSDERTYISKPVVAAMDAANACVKIASNQNIEISHDIANQGRVVTKFDFKDDGLTLRMTASTGEFICTTSTIDGQALETVSSREITRNSDFSVECKRKGVLVGNDIDFKAETIIFTTNKSDNYTIRLYPDTLYGITSRNEAEQKITELNKSVSDLNEQVIELNNRSIKPVRFYTGEKTKDLFGPKFKCNERTAVTAGVYHSRMQKKLCPKGELTPAVLVRSVSGNKCGYSYYLASCIQPGEN